MFKTGISLKQGCSIKVLEIMHSFIHPMIKRIKALGIQGENAKQSGLNQSLIESRFSPNPRSDHFLSEVSRRMVEWEWEGECLGRGAGEPWLYKTLIQCVLFTFLRPWLHETSCYLIYCSDKTLIQWNCLLFTAT